MSRAANVANLARANERNAAENAARREDLLWMVQGGENLTGAAERLGIKRGSLVEWCKDNNLLHELDKLRARDPYDHNAKGVYGRAS